MFEKKYVLSEAKKSKQDWGSQNQITVSTMTRWEKSGNLSPTIMIGGSSAAQDPHTLLSVS